MTEIFIASAFAAQSYQKVLRWLVVGGCLVNITVLAAAPGIAQAVKSRRANYKEIGGAFKTLTDEVKTGSPIIDVIKPAAVEIQRRGAMQMDFSRSSSQTAGEKTRMPKR